MPVPLLDEATASFLGTGCSMIVGTATPDGEPVAARGWGCAVVDNAPGAARLRLLMSLDDVVGHVDARPGDRVAVTATNVRTLRSVQLKGTILAIEEADGRDGATFGAYCEQLFRDIHETDDTSRDLFDQLVPGGVLVWVVEVGEAFDQTPGPAAGSPMPARAP
ncbi:MAG TPA: hypothetical protein VJ804_00145 [Acidimicrobiales bacterium]|nr:hypothetical protein [Acidimicrobiales bacterium]